MIYLKTSLTVAAEGDDDLPVLTLDGVVLGSGLVAIVALRSEIDGYKRVPGFRVGSSPTSSSPRFGR